MTNELFWLIEILANFFLIILAYKLFGKNGLLIWIPVSVIIANIQVVQAITIFGLSATLGNVSYAASFLVTDILSEKYGKQEARRAVWMGLFSLLAMTLLMQLTLRFIPMQADAFAADTHTALKTIFGLMPRIALASLIAYFLSQWHDVASFHFWKQRFPSDRMLWLRNNFSTMTSQLIDTLVFVMTAFFGVYPTSVLLEIFLTTYILKWLVAAADTPFVYWAKKIRPNAIGTQV